MRRFIEKGLVFFSLYKARFEPAGGSGRYPSLILAGRPWPAPREMATPWTSCSPLPFNPFRATPAATRLLLPCFMFRCVLVLGVLLFVLGMPFEGFVMEGAEKGDSAYFTHVVNTLSALGERRTGTQGAGDAARFIRAEFEKTGFKTGGVHTFSLPAVMGTGTTITPLTKGEPIGLTPFLGNVISPPFIGNPGLSAHLVHVGRGEISDFNKKNIVGSCVLMDLDSGKNWINALSLGAKALIYLVSPGSNRFLYQDKIELTPVDFPRFIMDRTQAQHLFGPLDLVGRKGSTMKVRLDSDFAWDLVQGENIYCLVPGSDPGSELMVIEAFYDAPAFVAGRSPGADQSCSIATLLGLARYLKNHPPRRSILLAATSGHGESLVGMREIVWSLTQEKESLKTEADQLQGLIYGAELALSDLVAFRSLAEPDREAVLKILGHVTESARNRVEILNSRLIALRLAGSTRAGLIAALANERMALKQLMWKSNAASLLPGDLDLVVGLVPEAILGIRQKIVHRKNRRQDLESTLEFKDLVDGFRLNLFVSLHLSSHGDGVGAFNQGGLYPIKETINTYPAYAELDDVLLRGAKVLDERFQRPGFFKDTLRPGFHRSWESYLMDRPPLGGEVSGLGGFLGITLATVNDARPFWGTPDDGVDRVDLQAAVNQSRYLHRLISIVDQSPGFGETRRLRNGFATVKGRANSLRFGEVFADVPATGAVVVSFQGQGVHHAMVDEAGRFYIKGVADKKHSLHKLIIEGYGFDHETGRINLAVDKRQTSKDGYRVKVDRLATRTDLVMFPCSQTTLVNLLEPRTFDYMTKIQVLDGSLDAVPTRYWYSRIDTRESTLCSVFLPLGTPLKLTLSDSPLTKKLILTHADPDHPQGRGYGLNDYPLIAPTQFLGARDMWALLNPRIDNLEQKGINNQKIRELRESGNLALEQAQRFLEAEVYDGFFGAAASSLALAGRVYRHVESVQKDVLFGVLFYIALFIPFAFCFERFAFGFTNIYRRIIAFVSILVLLIAIIYNVHPAFELAYSPVVVILAFFILALSALVAWIIFLRFEEGIKNVRQPNPEENEISLLAAFSASFFMGVANLRRRRLRTVLTCTTLIILTFTVMSFTSVKNVRQHTRMVFGDSAPYQGMLVKKLDWNPIGESAVSTLGTFFETPNGFAPRAWLETDDRTRAMSVPLKLNNTRALAHGVVGLSPNEPGISGFGLDGVNGRWFSKDEPYTVMISKTMAENLGFDPKEAGKAEIEIWSIPFRVVAVFDEKTFDDFKDLDGEPLSPVIFPDEVYRQLGEAEMEAMESGQDVKTFQSRYRHLGFDRTIIIPYTTLVLMGGQSVCVAMNPKGDVKTLGKNFVDRFGLWLFSGEKDGVYLYSASDTLDYSGISNILVPILISILIVLNTMIGSVYERKPEIGIYTSVGMAPLHVSILFVAEAMSYAVLSVVLGYLLAQTVATVFAGTALLSGITVNYSSLAGVGAMAMVMGVVLVSALYPSRVAAEIAIPDVEKSWKLTVSKGDKMVVDLPFLMHGGGETSAAGYLFDYFDTHREISQDVFTADELVVRRSTNQEQGFSICFRAWVAPFDLGLMQDVTLVFRESQVQQGYVSIAMEILRRSGEHNTWSRANRRFVNSIRKKLLVWRSLDQTNKEKWRDFFNCLDQEAEIFILDSGCRL